MKKIYFLFITSMVVLPGLQSCSKQSEQMLSSPSSNILQATISVNQPYQLTLDNSVRVGISKQASHFQISETELDTQSGSMVYRYLPTPNYTGTDEVTLTTTKATPQARTGCSSENVSTNNTYTTSYTILKFNITGN